MSGFMTGEGAVLVLEIDGKKLEPLDVESWSVKPNVTQISDKVCGENRARLDRLIESYSLSMKCFNATSAKLKSMLKYDASSDNNALQDVGFGLKLTDRKNGKALFVMTEAVIDDWNWANGGQKERQMLDIPVRARNMKPL